MCTEHGWNLKKKKKKSRLFIYILIVGLFVYLVYWARFVSCLLQCLRWTLGLQFGLQFGQFGIQLGHDPHPADSQSCQRPKQKDDGHDEKNVQAAGSPAAVFLERLNIHFCILLSQKSTVRWLNFGKYLQILSKANQKKKKSLEVQMQALEVVQLQMFYLLSILLLLSHRPVRVFKWMSRLCGSWWLFILYYVLSFGHGGKTRKSWISLSPLHTRPPPSPLVREVRKRDA